MEHREIISNFGLRIANLKARSQEKKAWSSKVRWRLEERPCGPLGWRQREDNCEFRISDCGLI
jgi:hypothetical protein